MKTRQILAVLILPAAGALLPPTPADATAPGATESGFSWCFGYACFHAETVTCVELPVAPPADPIVFLQTSTTE